MLKNALLLALFCGSLPGHAQEDAMMASGKVLDAATRKGIEASIRYSSIPTGSIYGRFQDSTFSFPVFGAVRYEITAEATGYNTRTVVLDPTDELEEKSVVRNIILTPAHNDAFRLKDLIFSRGEAEMQPQSYDELDHVVEMMKDNGKIVIQLEGHADNLGNPRANLKLSEERVRAVKNYLVRKGISKGRVKTKAFGGTQVATDDVNPESRDANRRVELRILRS